MNGTKKDKSNQAGGAGILLYIDDSAVARKAMQHSAQLAGLRVEVFSEPEELEQRVHEPFAALLLDVHLAAGRSGAELGRTLRAQFPGIPLAYFTSESELPEVHALRTEAPVFDKSRPEGMKAVLEWARTHCGSAQQR